ncbi:MAG: histidine kinase dimerization/phospho-acceptor domain-containing protein, partial [Erysipelotrichaceae bacterium]
MNKLPLKIKLTITSVVILFMMTMALTLTSFSAASELSQTTDTRPAENINGSIVGEQSAQTIDDVAISANSNALNKFKMTTGIAMFSLISLGSLLTYLFASKTLKPLENLVDATNHININNLDTNIPLPNTYDEVHRLTQSFNDMTTKLNASYQVQKNFSANAAHELRTPLAAVLTQLEVFALKDNRSIEEYEALFKNVNESTDRLSHLVTDLLNFTNDQDI